MAYLVSAVKYTDEAYAHYKLRREQVLMEFGVSVDVRVDWRAVANHCAPQVLILMAHDKQGTQFEDHPMYAILPESQQVVDLTTEISLSIQASDDDLSEVDVQGALNLLTTYANTMDSGKGENAMKQLRILQRIFR